MSKRVFAILFLILANFIQNCFTEILFKHCGGKADLGGTEKVGSIPFSCIRDHHFEGEEHAWDFRGSHIENTEFSSCTIRDTTKVRQRYDRADWDHVTFRDSHFLAGPSTSSPQKPSPIEFKNTRFQNVLFINCSFGEGVDLIFESFAINRLTFRHCRFAGQLFARNGEITELKFDMCTFGGRLVRSPKITRHRGDVLFSHVKLNKLTVTDSHGNANAIFISHSEVSDLLIRRSILGLVQCNENDVGDADDVVEDEPSSTCNARDHRLGRCDVNRPVSLEYTIIQNSSFTVGLHFSRAHIQNFFVKDTKIHGTFDLSYSSIKRLTLENVTPLENSTKSVLSLEGADVIDGQHIIAVNLSKVIFTDAVIANKLQLLGTNWTDSRVEVSHSVFGINRIGSKCCSEFCISRGCKCNVTEVDNDKGCPAIPAEVAFRSSDGMCFPATSRMLLANGETVRMDELQIGALAGAPSPMQKSNLGRVFFFGHRAPHVLGLFVQVKSAYCDAKAKNSTLRLSAGHFLILADGTFRAARDLRRGDMLQTANNTAVVTDVTYVNDVGLYAPVTTSGSIIVDDILVSCFTDAINERSAMALLAPPRWFFIFGGQLGTTMIKRATWLHEHSVAHWGARLERFGKFLQSVFVG